MNSDNKSFRRLVLFLVLKLDKNDRKSAKLILIYVLMILRLVMNYIALEILYRHSSTQSLYIGSREKGSTKNMHLCTRAVPEVRDYLGGTLLWLFNCKITKIVKLHQFFKKYFCYLPVVALSSTVGSRIQYKVKFTYPKS